MIKSKVRAYNALAISAPDCCWTPKFMHPRMVLIGAAIMLQYTHRSDNQNVPVKQTIAPEELDNEMKKLKKRIKERA